MREIAREPQGAAISKVGSMGFVLCFVELKSEISCIQVNRHSLSNQTRACDDARHPHAGFITLSDDEVIPVPFDECWPVGIV
jgi:hypothetical protein